MDDEQDHLVYYNSNSLTSVLHSSLFPVVLSHIFKKLVPLSLVHFCISPMWFAIGCQCHSLTTPPPAVLDHMRVSCIPYPVLPLLGLLIYRVLLLMPDMS